MQKRFRNIKKKINNLIISKKYYVSIPAAKKNSSFEEEYHFESVDPDGKKRRLLNERKNFLVNNKHTLNFLKRSKPGKIIDVGCGLGWFMSTLDNKWEKYGTDISKFALINASNYCNTIHGDIEKILRQKKIKKNLTM